MNQLFRFPSAVAENPEVEAWMVEHPGPLGEIALQWFDVMRTQGEDVRELLHDGHPTACVEDAAFGYVDAFTSHVNVGFYRGADLPDPEEILVGSGKSMRHVKIGPESSTKGVALFEVIEAAYADMKRQLQAE